VVRNRLFILSTFAEEPSFEYNETVLGISWDQRFHENWSWRAGIRYIDKQVFPPDKAETRGVFDLKWFQPVNFLPWSDDWLFTSRNRVDVRRFQGSSKLEYRLRNRLQLEVPITLPLIDKVITGFGSYENYYDSRYGGIGQRHRFIGGISIPFSKRFSTDVFYGYHIETKPKRETGEAFGVAFGFYF
jgi:hypothetical protein